LINLSLVSAKCSANRREQMKKRLHFLADNAERKNNPKSAMTQCLPQKTGHYPSQVLRMDRYCFWWRHAVGLCVCPPKWLSLLQRPNCSTVLHRLPNARCGFACCASHCKFSCYKYKSEVWLYTDNLNSQKPRQSYSKKSTKTNHKTKNVIGNNRL